jgi:hypothetical protein
MYSVVKEYLKGRAVSKSYCRGESEKAPSFLKNTKQDL